MGNLLLTVLPLGLAAAITPTLFALQVLVVSGPSWRRRAASVLLGAGAVFVVVFALVLGGLSQLPDAGTGKSSSMEYTIELVCGVVLLPVAAWMLRPHPHADATLEKKVSGYVADASPLVFTGLAAYMAVTDFSSLVLIVPALHDVTLSALAVVEKAAVVVLLFVLVMLPVWVPPLIVQIAGQRGVRVLNRVYTGLMGHQVQVMGAVAGLIGALLIYRGARGLL